VNLTPEDIERALKKGEGARREFKRILPRDGKAARSMCALANTRGGLLLIGVTDRRRVHGVHRPAEVIAALEAAAARELDPPLEVELQQIEVGGPSVVACSVPLSKDRPHALLLPSGEKEIVIRVGASNRVASGPTLEALRSQRRSRRNLTPLDERILDWVARDSNRTTHPGGTATIARFAKRNNVGENRARKAFVKLERLGLLFGHGSGRTRIYHAA
jgi:predicted HTH transcriptional regulator